jgi:hypothetical protein
MIPQERYSPERADDIAESPEPNKRAAGMAVLVMK